MIARLGRCLANTPLGGNDPKAWKMQFPHVPAVLASLHAAGHAIVIVTNESSPCTRPNDPSPLSAASLPPTAVFRCWAVDRFKKPEAIRSAILKKCGRLDGFAAACALPMLALCATSKDAYRKPGTAAWDFFTAKCNGGVPVDYGASFFVGDAAGRPGDHSDSDKAFAAAAGLIFHDEKSFFLERHPPP